MSRFGASGLVQRPPAVGAIAAFTLALMALFLRRPSELLVAEFWADDGPNFTDALDRGARTIVEPLGGTLVLAQRLVVLLETAIQPMWAPVIGNAVALATTALVAAFFATRLPLPAQQRCLIAAIFVFLPGSSDVLGSISHLQWICGAFLIAYALVRPGPTWELVGLAVAALTGPLVLVVLPLYIGRWLLDRTAGRPLSVILVCAGVQIVALYISSRFYVSPDVGMIPETIVTRITHMPGFTGLVLVAMVAVAGRRAHRSTQVALAYLIVAIPLAGLLRATEPTAAYLMEGAGSRYFWLSTGLLASIVIMGRPGWTRTAAIAVFAVMFLVGAIIPAHRIAGWAETSACIGRPTACVVPVEPTDFWGDAWAVRYSPD